MPSLSVQGVADCACRAIAQMNHTKADWEFTTEAGQLARDRGSDHRRQLSCPGELAIPSAQSLLSFPCDVTDRLGQTLLAQQLLSADPRGKAPGFRQRYLSRPPA